MGFASLIPATVMALPSVFQADASFAQSKTLRQAADVQQRLGNQQAAAVEHVASANQMRGSRNAHAQLARARVDAAASNTAQEGSTYRRGMDLATRLQDEINANANEQLNRANALRSQAAYDAWNLRNQAKQSKMAGIGAIASGVGTFLGVTAMGLMSGSGAGAAEGASGAAKGSV